MSVASNVSAIWKDRFIGPPERRLLASVVGASVLLLATALPVWSYLFSAQNKQPVELPAVSRSLPHIPNMLLGDLPTEESEVVSTETYLFNFRANSFKYLSYPGVDVAAEQLRKSFGVLMLPIRHRMEFLAALVDEARIQNVHPCFVSAVLQAPFSSELQAPIPVTSLLAGTPAEAFSRAAVSEMAVDSYAELAAPDTAARIAVRYIQLLQEIYPAQGNIVILAFWSDVDAIKARLGGELPFEVQDLELLQSAVTTYGRCLTDIG